MVRSVLTALAAILMTAPGLAFAQAAVQAGSGQVVATAPAAPVAPPQRTPAGQVASVSDTASDDDSAQNDGPLRDNRVHGEISVGAGTDGYREISGAATVPLGDVGQASIAIDSSQSEWRR